MYKHIYIIILTIAVCFVGIHETMAQSKPFIVVLDAGHGGKDPGAIGNSNANREKDINLAITLEVGRLLKQNCPDVKLIYTRNTDVFVELGERANIANKAKADLFVSIHTNASPKKPSTVHGVQAYTLTLRTAGTNLEVEKRENSVIQFESNGAQKYSFNNPNSSESDIMFELMQDRDMQESVNFAKTVQNEMVQGAGRSNMGVHQANLAVLRLTYMPSVLLEVGYISTPAEEQFLMSNEGRVIMGKSIYNAIVKYKNIRTGRMSSLERIDLRSVNAAANNEQKANEQPVNAQHQQAAKPQAQQSAKAQPQPANAQKQDNKPAAKADANANANASASADAPVFKIQIATSPKRLVSGCTQLKGLDAEYYREGDIYKYTYGSTTNYNEIQKKLKSIASKFPDAFVVAFLGDQKIELQKAINIWKTKK